MTIESVLKKYKIKLTVSEFEHPELKINEERKTERGVWKRVGEVDYIRTNGEETLELHDDGMYMWYCYKTNGKRQRLLDNKSNTKPTSVSYRSGKLDGMFFFVDDELQLSNLRPSELLFNASGELFKESLYYKEESGSGIITFSRYYYVNGNLQSEEWKLNNLLHNTKTGRPARLLYAYNGSLEKMEYYRYGVGHDLKYYFSFEVVTTPKHIDNQDTPHTVLNGKGFENLFIKKLTQASKGVRNHESNRPDREIQAKF